MTSALPSQVMSATQPPQKCHSEKRRKLLNGETLRKTWKTDHAEALGKEKSQLFEEQVAAEEVEEEDPDLFRILASSDEVKSCLPKKVMLVCLVWKLSGVLSTFYMALGPMYTLFRFHFHLASRLVFASALFPWDVVAHQMLWSMGCCGTSDVVVHGMLWHIRCCGP